MRSFFVLFASLFVVVGFVCFCLLVLFHSRCTVSSGACVCCQTFLCVESMAFPTCVGMYFRHVNSYLPSTLPPCAVLRVTVILMLLKSVCGSPGFAAG